MYFIFVYQYGRRRINAIFGSDDDSKSNLSFSDVNVDADLSDIEVQEFSKKERGESESEDSKSNNSTTSDRGDEPESFNSDVYTSRMSGVDRADQLRSFYLFGVAIKKVV